MTDMNLRNRIVALALIVAFTAGCATGPAIQVEQVDAPIQCQNVAQGVTPISMQQLASLKGSRLLTPPSQQQQAGDAADQAAPTSQMYAIYDGRKPTGGYQLTFSQVKEMDTWEMHFTLIQPEPGSVVTQAMTQPCSVIMVTGQTDKALSFWLDGKRLK